MSAPGLLNPTSDRKTKFWPGQKNTFGLLPGAEGSCPGCTTGPGGCCDIPEGRKTPVCYVNKTLSYSKATYLSLKHNTDLLKGCGQDVAKMAGILSAEFARFLSCEKRRPRDRHNLLYRLHWSGDVFNVWYAKAIRLAVMAYPEIMFWNYTRSFFALRHLAGIPNMVQYLSLDRVNLDKGLQAYRENGGAANRLAVCAMSPDKPEIAGLEFHDCPADTGESPVDGACARCRRCLLGYNIWFKQK